MKQLKHKDIKEIREMLCEKVDWICPVSGLDLRNGNATCDHSHEDSTHPNSETVEGQVRGPLHRFANSLEGQMRAKFRRSGLAKEISFEEFLFNLYNYLMDFREPMIHPMSAPKHNKLTKRSYNKLAKEIKQTNEYLTKKIKLPPYPKSKRLTKKLKELYDKFGIYPEYYTK